MICAISGAEASNPCVTPQGNVFEKRVLLSLLTTNGGLCPVTKAPLSEDDLIDIVPAPVSTVPAAPTSVSGQGFGGLLATMQTEWDALMVETFNLRTSLEETRRELSQALYQNDAAVRVIARLTMERDQARQMLASNGGGSAPSADAAAMDVEPESTDEQGIPQADLDVMVEKWGQLSAGRKGRAIPEDQATPSDVKSLKMGKSSNLHKASGKTGISCVSVCVADPDKIATGGVDKQVIIFSRSKGKMVATKTAGSKPVTSVAWLESSVITGSADGTVKIFSGDDFDESGSVDLGEAVVSISPQPTGEYIIASTSSSSVSVISTSGGLNVISTLKDPSSSTYTSSSIHPDGLIVGCGTSSGSIKIWDLKKSTLAGTIEAGTGPINCLSFAENGYYAVAGCEDGYAYVLDLRKMKSIGKVGGDDWGSIVGVEFDYGVKMLAVVGEDKGGIVEVKKWGDVIVEVKGHKKGMTGFGWGEKGRWAVTVGMDRAMKQWTI
ncbi:hypothetical protein TrST_g12558 [Triparma strigata]|uniref:Pre-mRNA-processing factor 19 n=1 Tax=Triparma strigata TaxID=1606541 RepID=A0A9W7EKW8_9STRA|nr:hypothetical protein TrST_g12558 [Triparma strigata]